MGHRANQTFSGGSLNDDVQGTTNFVSGHAEPSDTNAATLLAAPGSGLKNYVTEIVIFPKALATAAVNILTFKTGTTTLFVATVHNPNTIPAAGSVLPVHLKFRKPIQCGDNETFNVTLGVASTANVLAQGFIGT